MDNSLIDKEVCGVELYWSVKVWPKWQIVIPNNARKELWIKPWDTLLVGTKHWKLVWFLKPEDIEKFSQKMKEEVDKKPNSKEFANKEIEKFRWKLNNQKNN